MGTFGTEIAGNDEYLDLEVEFFKLYNEGLEVSTISNKIIQKHNESLNSDEDSNNFWLALADFQWQCKALEEDVLDKIKDIVNSESDLKLWKELGSEQADIEERRIVLREFLTKISTPVKRAKKRVKKKLFDSVFKKGDLIIYKLNNGNYGGAIVIFDELQTEQGLNWVVLTNLDLNLKPCLKDFLNSKIQYYKDGDYTYPMIIGLFGYKHNTDEDNNIQIEVIQNVSLKEDKIEEGVWYLGCWNNLRKRTPNSIFSEDYTQNLLNLTKQKWWEFWK